jgi:acetylglutamate kinase
MKLFVVKIGGNVLDNPANLESFLKDFASIREPRILVHGGGKIASSVGDRLGITSRYVAGRRITDRETLDLVTMVYGGLVNKRLVAHLQAMGCNAFGVTGADGDLLRAVKRSVKDIDYGFVGDITPVNVNIRLLETILAQEIVPVFAPLTHADGVMLNTNGDTISSVLAISLSAKYDVRLIYCFEKKGILQDVGNPESVVRHLNRTLYNTLLEKKALTEGILPKLDNAFAAISSGVKEVLIGEAADLLQNTGNETAGTLITE